MKIKIIAIPILLTFCIMGTLSGCNKSSNNTTSTINSGNTVNSPDNNIKDTIKVEDSKKASNFTKEKEISENSAGKSNGYEIINKTYNKNNIKINYPQVKNLADSAKLKSINKNLEAQALNILDIYLEDDANLTEVTMDINYEVKLKNNKYISIVYLGEGNVKGAAYPQSIIYTTNIDIEKGSSIRLSDYADIHDILVKLKDSNNIRHMKINNKSKVAMNIFHQARR